MIDPIYDWRGAGFNLTSCKEKSDNPEPCWSSFVSGPEITHSMEDSCSDVIDEVPGVYPKNTDMEPDSEEVIIDTGKLIGNIQTVSETLSEGYKGENQQSQPNLE